MQKSLQNLLDLQAVDVRLSEVRARLASFPKKLAEANARAAGARAELDQSKVAQVAAIRDRKKYELDVEQWKERVRKYRDQSIQVKTNEAYKAMQHEVQTAEGEIAKAEDRLLEQMVAAEEYDRRVKASERLLKEVEEVVKAERAKIEVEKSAAERGVATFTAERAGVIANIPENLLDHYDRIRKKHGGVALAEVRDEKCTACGMRIRPHVFQEMQRTSSEEMFHCETCTRILYLKDADAPAPTERPAQASA
jgi:predicted  nucleic acid-binding Zn-ribbon protein